MTLRTYLLLALSASAVSAATYPAGFSEELVASGLNAPAAMALPPMAACSFVSRQATCE